MSKEPDWTALPSNTPAPILGVLRECLQKDRNRRLADIADARLDIEEALSPTKQRDRRFLWTAVTAAVPLAVFLAVRLLPRGGSAPAPLLASVVIELPGDWFILDQSPALSPDSRSVVFSALHESGRSAIWLRPLDASAPRILSDTDDGHAPFWSPDSDALGFFAQGNLKVRRMSDGLVLALCDAPIERTGTGSRRRPSCLPPTQQAGLPKSASRTKPCVRSRRSIARPASCVTPCRCRFQTAASSCT